MEPSSITVGESCLKIVFKQISIEYYNVILSSDFFRFAVSRASYISDYLCCYNKTYYAHVYLAKALQHYK